ncbi:MULTISPECIES: PepSY domain-containing protein [unclassified Streptomyces]|uniref:PepSY domain-containing protein n=1 Tax=unclassified Streptomyces TaxID=2593676 RepID=UPI002E29F84B|nr:PepSY domain-containing protein [Streptomyces sp. NBC_01422]WSS64277.1 PepSY domain-containing protein [Streptomyces sp. NBC_01177]WSS71273.1 PepSY domain-containing protein [Streptomyces sp. NBC_01175]
MKRNTAIAALTAAVLVGGGLATTAAFADSDGTRTDDSTASAGTAAGRTGAGQAVTEKTGKAGRTTVDEAVGAALKAVPGTVTEAELDDDDDDGGRTVWELDVYGADKVWHDVTVDAGSGKLLSDREDDNGDRDRHAPRSAAVSLDAALKAALGAQPGTVTSVDLDDDDDDDGRRGAPRWDVDITGKDGKQHELRVDAKSGKVTADHDDDHDDDSDDRDGDDD